jgi:hypothetical protein
MAPMSAKAGSAPCQVDDLLRFGERSLREALEDFVRLRRVDVPIARQCTQFSRILPFNFPDAR